MDARGFIEREKDMKNTLRSNIEKMKLSASNFAEKIENVVQEIRMRVRMNLSNTDGIGVVEMILILVVLIGLVLIFKSQLTTLVGDIFDTITNESSTV